MPRTHSSRSRSCSRSHRRHRKRHESRESSRNKSRERGRSRSRLRSHSRPRYQSRSQSRSRTPPVVSCKRPESKDPKSRKTVNKTLDTILTRLEAIENNFTSTPIPRSEISTPSAAQTIVDAIQAINPIRSHNYYISNFDPSIHDIDAWCEEVDRAQLTNRWNDKECLSRVAGCLRGDAKTWLNEWVTSDRSWTSFKREFKPLCPRKLDYANILFETMNQTSDKYNSYAEYARRSLLRLRIVKGLSEELMTLIVIRGITNAQVRQPLTLNSHPRI